MNIKRFPQIASNIFKYEMVSHHIAAKNHCTALHGLRQKLCFMVSKVLAPLHRPSFSAQLTPLATHWTLQLYEPSSHTLTVCWETRSLWVSQDSTSPGSRCTACLCSGLSCQGSFYSEQPQKTEILPCLPWSMNKQADHHYKIPVPWPWGSSSCKKTHSMCRCHLTLFLLPVGMGAQRTNRKADTLATVIAGRNKLSSVSCSLVFCQHPQNHGKLTC